MDLTQTELLIIVGCAVLGWVIVSRLIAAGDESVGDIDPDAPWHVVLGLPEHATRDQIETACQQRLDALEKNQPTVPTLPEQARYNDQRQTLQRARDTGMTQAQPTER